jgi:hypothetical protein
LLPKMLGKTFFKTVSKSCNFRRNNLFQLIWNLENLKKR